METTKSSIPKMMLTVACGVLVAGANTVNSQTYDYDAQGRLTKVIYSDSMSVAYSYDSNSNILSTTVEGDLGTSVQEPESEILPKVFALRQNYPNPFNPTTTIEFDLPRASHVKLTVYNILGGKVEVLANKEYSAGKFNVQWSASNYSSGVYVYQLRASSFVQTRKLLLLR